jgi:hypothetical protein
MIWSKRSPLAAVLTACLGLVMLSACEDPSGVGLGVIDFGDTDPRTRSVPAEAVMGPLVDATGFVRPLDGEFDQRFIVGRAEDPLFGTVTATGYIQFVRPSEVPASFFVTEIEEAFLELRTDYTFGDTTRDVVVDIYEIEEGWNPAALHSDTTLAVHPNVVTSFRVAAGDTLFQVPLPQSWVAQRDTLLRSERVAQDWHGFQLRPRVESGVALGFTGRSMLHVIGHFGDESARDTVSFQTAGIATGTKRDLSTASVPPNLFPVQDNTGMGLIMTFRLDTLDTRAISAGVIRVEADTLLAEASRPANFIRPIARRLVLYGMGAGPPTVLAEAELDTGKEAYIFSSSILNRTLQELAFNRGPFDSFGVGFARSSSTLDVAPLLDDPAAPPRVILLVVPQNM